MSLSFKILCTVVFLLLPLVRSEYALAEDYVKGAPSYDQEIMVPFYIGNQYVDDVVLYLDEMGEQVFVKSAGFALLVKSYILVERYEKLATEIARSEVLTIGQLKSLGLEFEFDQEDVVARLRISPSIKAMNQIHLSSSVNKPVIQNNMLKPATNSAGIDFNFIFSKSQTRELIGKLNLDSHYNWHGWVLENNFHVPDLADNLVVRSGSRMIFNHSDRLVRLKIGDIQYSNIGLMGNKTFSGLVLEKAYDLNPYNMTYPLRNQTLFLDNNSKVKMYINDTLGQTLNLPAGSHQLSGLPLIDGINQVRLEIRDIYGKVKQYDYQFSQDVRLLKKGLNEYMLALGVERNTSTSRLIYDQKKPILALFYYQGIHDNYTGGGHLEANEDTAMIGQYGIVNSLVGQFEYDVGVSRGHEWGYGLQSQYQYRGRKWSLNAQFGWQSENFAKLGQQ